MLTDSNSGKTNKHHAGHVVSNKIVLNKENQCLGSPDTQSQEYLAIKYEKNLLSSNNQSSKINTNQKPSSNTSMVKSINMITIPNH